MPSTTCLRKACGSRQGHRTRSTGAQNRTTISHKQWRLDVSLVQRLTSRGESGCKRTSVARALSSAAGHDRGEQTSGDSTIWRASVVAVVPFPSISSGCSTRSSLTRLCMQVGSHVCGHVCAFAYTSSRFAVMCYSCPFMFKHCRAYRPFRSLGKHGSCQRSRRSSLGLVLVAP